MPRIPKPWFRRQSQTWYVQLHGRKVNLGPDEKKAWEKFHAMMASGGSSNVTARMLIRLYADWAKDNNAPSTLDRKRPVLESLGNALPARLKAEDLRPFHVQQWVKSLSLVKSPTTVNSRITLAKTVWNWGESMGHLTRNPIAKMKKPRARVRQEFVPPDLWKKVLGLATDQEFRDYLTLMLATGARPQELHDLRVEHVQDGSFVFPIDDSKGRKKSRVIYIPDEAQEIVRRLVSGKTTGHLLVNSKGRPWTRNSVRLRFRYLKRELGIPKLCATMLRHSFAHHRLTQGQDALVVSKLMGHVDTRMIATRYGHIESNVQFMQAAANQHVFPE